MHWGASLSLTRRSSVPLLCLFDLNSSLVAVFTRISVVSFRKPRESCQHLRVVWKSQCSAHSCGSLIPRRTASSSSGPQICSFKKPWHHFSVHFCRRNQEWLSFCLLWTADAEEWSGMSGSGFVLEQLWKNLSKSLSCFYIWGRFRGIRGWGQN